MTAPAMPVDPAALLALAQKATPGPWEADEFRLENWRVKAPDGNDGCWWIAEVDGPPGEDGHNAAYIAALSPDVLTALVTRYLHYERVLDAIAYAPTKDAAREALRECLRVSRLAPSIGISGLCTGKEKAVHDAETALASTPESATIAARALTGAWCGTRKERKP